MLCYTDNVVSSGGISCYLSHSGDGDSQDFPNALTIIATFVVSIPPIVNNK